MFTRVYLCLHLFTYVYSVYSFLPMFTTVYLCLPIFIMLVYVFLPILHVFTYDYTYLLMFTFV